jgi:hypothetical protein
MYDPTLGRWHVIDPAIENNHFDYTPYAYVYNNPLRFIDPLGLDSVNIYSDGTMCIDEGSTTSDTYYYYDADGNMHTVGTFDKNDQGLIQLPSDFSYTSEDGNLYFGFTVKEGNEDKSYASQEAFGALIGAIAETNTTDLVVIGFSNADGSSPSPSKSHKNGKNGDIRYLKTDYSGNAGYNFDSDFDWDRQSTLNHANQGLRYVEKKLYK